jgi:hypothetical protein
MKNTTKHIQESSSDSNIVPYGYDYKLHTLGRYNHHNHQHRKSNYIEGKRICIPYNKNNRPWRPIGLREVEAPISSRKLAHRWRQGC